MKDWKQELDGLAVSVLGQSDEVVLPNWTASTTQRFDRDTMQRLLASVEPAQLTAPTQSTTPPASGEVEAPTAWLCCRPLPPLPLAGPQKLVIGRAPGCFLVLPHVEVSRRHATIEVLPGGLLRLDDGGSSNGTLVNDKRVSVASLEEGDVITVGPYHMKILCEEDALTWEAEAQADDSNRESEAPDSLSEQAHMSGRLDKVPLREVIQQIEFNAYTGTLQVSSGRRRGWLVVEAGKPRAAAFDKMRDGEALLAMLRLKEGRFSVVRTPDLGPRRMSGSLTGMLLEAARCEDDQRSSTDDEGNALCPIAPEPKPVPAPRLSTAAPHTGASSSRSSDTPRLPVARLSDPAKVPARRTPPPRGAASRAARRPSPALPGPRGPAETEPGAPALRPGMPEWKDAGAAPAPPPSHETQALPPAEVPDLVDLPDPVAVALRSHTTRLPRAEAYLMPASSPARFHGAHPGWLLGGILTLLSVTLAGPSLRAGGPPPDVEARVGALEREVERALASTVAIAGDARLGALRGEAEALRTLGTPSALMARSLVALQALDGLSCAARGDLAATRAAHERVLADAAWPGVESALRGALAAITSDADPRSGRAALDDALAHGVGRPELRRWRARLTGRAGLITPEDAAEVLEDLAVADAALAPDAAALDDVLLRVRALRQLGRSAEARTLLDEVRAQHARSAWIVALGSVDHAIARGDPAEALRILASIDPAAFGAPPPEARELGARVLAEAMAAAASASSERPARPACDRLLALLRLARRLEAGPAPIALLEPLLRAVDAPGPIDASLCLGVAEVGAGQAAIRQRVLTRIYLALESGTVENGLDMSILLILVCDPASGRGPHDRDLIVDVARRADVRADLYEARATARAVVGRMGEALRDVDRALALRPARPEAKDLKVRLEEAIRTGSTSLAR